MVALHACHTPGMVSVIGKGCIHSSWFPVWPSRFSVLGSFTTQYDSVQQLLEDYYSTLQVSCAVCTGATAGINSR